jgi:uncharacterized protein YcbK (DUF882 family)
MQDAGSTHTGGDSGPLIGVRKMVFSIITAIVMACPSPVFGETHMSRFFLMGDGELHIRNSKTGDEVRADLLSPDGSFNEEGLAKIDRVFGFPSHKKGEHMSLRMLFMLDYFSDLAAPEKIINIESGYRSPEYNTKLRNAGGIVAKTSTHMDGMALDFNIEGVDGRRLWELIRSKDCCGAGYYGGKNVHLDSARPRFWEAATSKVTTGESDFNRRIYLSTDYDRYHAGEPVRLSFAAVSNYGFGVGKEVSIVKDSSEERVVAKADIRSTHSSACIMIEDREAARSLYFSLPDNLAEGTYRVKLDFCSRPFEQMPEGRVSNRIEISGNGAK